MQRLCLVLADGGVRQRQCSVDLVMKFFHDFMLIVRFHVFIVLVENINRVLPSAQKHVNKQEHRAKREEDKTHEQWHKSTILELGLSSLTYSRATFRK